ncbi:hypothetical protein BJAS_P3282 [Bathymodiolus japonicus methanotrophic gill symbiont]|uniref:helix-turn-helix domain-containing protein n=1 Tax=Bathymodiolus japonicus methanotrophic gill symbiont TaxID=113269 RepID=UPI001B5B7331|nr:helix-turn-helix domain-containing protein [Bathymodiolus japonicus methanotrophic gill symbiont]GFO72784.1 hypothetical protein BJAS_P3282 [Bathymodiolus japonicus methanotrophic gill symbiont]
MATTNGSTAIRDKILASLARYRALRIGKISLRLLETISPSGADSEGTSHNKIAKSLGRSQSNISREIKRNTGLKVLSHKSTFPTLSGFCRKKNKYLCKINCNLFLCDKWTKHHRRRKTFSPHC